MCACVSAGMEGRLISPSTPNSRGMDKYEQLAVVGEGSYGVVFKCPRRDTGQLVAIKKFLETEEDAAVRKMALREIRMLKKLRHDHLVNMIEVFRRKRRFYLVFEYLDHTLLDELEQAPRGLGDEVTKKYLYQLLRGIDYCHQNAIIHRDVKPENVLIGDQGIVKLCDLGFARTLAAPGEPYTEYVATRWYRAPELLVAEHRYGTEVDIWAIGCLFAEMLTGNPLFPGDSDIDQLALIVKTVGKLAPRHQQIVSKLSGGAALSGVPARVAALPAQGLARDLMAACLRTEPRARPSASALRTHKYFKQDNFIEKFTDELRRILGKDIEIPPTPTPLTSSTQVAGKPRQPWTLNIIQDYQSRSPSESMGPYPGLVDSKQTCSSEALEVKEKNKFKTICPQTKVCGEGPPNPRAPAPPAHPPLKFTAQKPLSKAINDAFQRFPVPVTTYPRTPYIKRVKNKLFMDEEMRGKVPATQQKPKKVPPPDFSLPFVSCANNSPIKKAKKPSQQPPHPPIFPYKHSSDREWDGARGPEQRTPTNLPYM